MALFSGVDGFFNTGGLFDFKGGSSDVSFNKLFDNLGPRKTTDRPGINDALQTDTAENQMSLLLSLLDQTPDLSGGLSQILGRGQSLLGTTPQERLDTNLGFARVQADRQGDQIGKALSTQQAEGGQTNAGFSQTQQNSAQAAARASTLDSAAQRSFGESIASNQLGGQLIQQLTTQQQGFSGLLTDMISRLLAAGTAAESQSFAARKQAASNQFSSSVGALSL